MIGRDDGAIVPVQTNTQAQLTNKFIPISLNKTEKAHSAWSLRHDKIHNVIVTLNAWEISHDILESIEVRLQRAPASLTYKIRYVDYKK